MDSEHYSDPLREGIGRAAQNAAQLVSVFAVAGQVAAEIRIRKAEQAKARTEQEWQALQDAQEAAQAEAKAHWARADDPVWLAEADLAEVGALWAHAAPWAANGEADAEAVMTKAEVRLRDLHPYAMSHYDRLRESGLGAVDAMKQAAPFFGYPPRTFEQPRATQRSALEQHASPVSAAVQQEQALAREQAKAAYRRLAQNAIDRIRNQTGGDELDPQDLGLRLATTTNLPQSVIDEAVAASTDRPVTRRPDAAALAALDHPRSIEHVMESTTKTPQETTPATRPVTAPTKASPRT